MAEVFYGIIQDLSQTYGTPVFEPHVTIVSGLSGDEEALVSTIDAFAASKEILSAPVEGLDYQEGFFKALFLNVQNTPALDQLNQQARMRLNPFGQGVYEPHLSLLYGDITVEEKNQIIAQLTLPFQTITFDRLKLVQGHSDVTQWRVVKTWSLA